MPVSLMVPMLDELLLPLVPAVLELDVDPAPCDTSVRMNPPLLPLERLALVLPAAPVDPVPLVVEPVPDVPVVPLLDESPLIRQPVSVTWSPRLLLSRSLCPVLLGLCDVGLCVVGV